MTERGIVIRPLGKDMVDRVTGSKLPIQPIQDIKKEIERTLAADRRAKRARFLRLTRFLPGL